MLDVDGVPADEVLLQAPKQVTPVPRLKFDVDALEKLFEGPDPVVVKARASSVAAFYLMGDTSGTGFWVCLVEWRWLSLPSWESCPLLCGPVV